MSEKETVKSMASRWAMPGAIVIAAALIAGAILFKDGGNAVPTPGAGNEQPTGKVAPVTDADHYRGPENAKVTIVEYSDLECPYCKTFHQTLVTVTKDFPTEVGWVYRHFPLDQIHKTARAEAEASECAATLGGDTAFWKFIDRLFEVTKSNDGLAASELPKIATFAGVDVTKFQACMASKATAQAVQDDVQSGIDAGVRGTPHAILLNEDGEVVGTISGAQPYATVKATIEAALK